MPNPFITSTYNFSDILHILKTTNLKEHTTYPIMHALLTINTSTPYHGQSLHLYTLVYQRRRGENERPQLEEKRSRQKNRVG